MWTVKTDRVGHLLHRETLSAEIVLGTYSSTAIPYLRCCLALATFTDCTIVTLMYVWALGLLGNDMAPNFRLSIEEISLFLFMLLVLLVRGIKIWL